MPFPTPADARARLSGYRSVLLAIALGLIAGAFEFAPLHAQVASVVASRIDTSIPADDVWAQEWDEVPAAEIPMSAQTIVPPFGGGGVDAVTVRTVFDDEQIHVLVEWPDEEPDMSVNRGEAFSDAVALQFPGSAAAEPPYTMGAAGLPVNIWHWKAVWQADIDDGFATSLDNYPNTQTDFYQQADDTTFNPARAVGNLMAERDRTTPVENLVAEGFGTLTTAEIQDVTGRGEWRDGTWRALFSRSLAPSSEGLAEFVVDGQTKLALAVWDGSASERNGQKSITQFVEFGIGSEPQQPAAQPEAQPSVVPQAAAEKTPVNWGPIVFILASLTLAGAAVALGKLWPLGGD